MYEIFLSNSVISKKTQNVNEEFILKYNDYSCEQLNSLWKEIGLGSYYDGLFKIIEPDDLKDIINQCYIMDDDESLLPLCVQHLVMFSLMLKIKDLGIM